MSHEEAAERLLQNRLRIVKLWESRARKEVASAQRKSQLVLQDDLEVFLQQLAEALSTDSESSPQRLAREAGERGAIIGKHGSLRATQIGYILHEVIFEFHLLRQVVFAVLEENSPLTRRERDIILDSIEQAVNDAANSFSEAIKQLRDQFTLTLTHDLRGPLTTARAAAQLILRRPARPGQIEKMAFHVIESMDRLDSMIQDILNASKLQAGEKLPLEKTAFELDSLVREVVDEYLISEPERIVVLSPLHVVGEWSIDGLRRILQNLITNAVKFGAPRSTITVKLEATERNVRLTVHNSGNPIPEEKQAVLFEPFQQLKGSVGKPGWGLGLFLVHGIVEAHDGTIRVESSENTGTSFIVDLPRSRLMLKAAGQ